MANAFPQLRWRAVKIVLGTSPEELDGLIPLASEPPLDHVPPVLVTVREEGQRGRLRLHVVDSLLVVPVLLGRPAIYSVRKR